MSISLDAIKKVHFVGIGGIGVSALARMMLLSGKRVSGSDSTPSIVTDRLGRLGAKIYIGHKEKNIPRNTDILVYSPAVSGNNPELMTARARGIPAYSYPEMLGIISKGKYTIAISGTHGKTTTTAMVAEILIDTERDPTVVVGSFLKKKKDNFVGGKSDLFVVEACEYRRSFLNLSPDILVITNIDADHLDYYGDLAGVQKAFSEMAQKVPKDGFIVCDPGDKRVKPALKRISANIIDYTKTKTNITLPIPGHHNIKNACAALAVARLLEIGKKRAEHSLEHFHGTWRRMEYKGKTHSGVSVYDDYAHHPTEVRKTLEGFRNRHKKGRITVVFQPHLYSRTKQFLNDFAKSFKDADEVIITDIYAAREYNDGTIHARDLTAKIGKEKASYLGDFSAIAEYLKKDLKKGDILITMGAGDVYSIGGSLFKNFKL